MSDERPWMGTNAAADYLGITLRTVYGLINRGELPAYKIGRVMRLRRHEVDAFLDSARVRAGALDHLLPDARASAWQMMLRTDRCSSRTTKRLRCLM